MMNTTVRPFALAALADTALPQGIVDVLNFALTLEYLESSFYNAGVGTSGLIPASDLAIFQQIQKHENAHVAFLESVLGSAAAAKPTFDFTAGGMFADVFSNYATFQAVSQAFEDTGVRAYKGQAANLMSAPDILTAALQIHSVEARHAAEVRRLRGLDGWIIAKTGNLPAAVNAAVYGPGNPPTDFPAEDNLHGMPPLRCGVARTRTGLSDRRDGCSLQWDREGLRPYRSRSPRASPSPVRAIVLGRSLPRAPSSARRYPSKPARP
jgi:hypothetical protein